MQFPSPNSHSHPQPPNPVHFLLARLSTCPLKTHFQSAVQSLGGHARRALHSSAALLPSPPIGPTSPSSATFKTPAWARMSRPEPAAPGPGPTAMTTEAIEERLAGVPVYALSNAAGEFVLVSGVRSGSSLGLFCFKEEDAVAMLEQMRTLNQDSCDGSKVVAIALNKVFQLKVDGVAFRLIPDSNQVANAIKEKEKAGESIEGFFGVPVFQSRSLVLRSQNKRYRPVFFRKEDLEDSLLRASREQNTLNPAFRRGDIQVGVLEEIINVMMESSSSKWDDVVFIPPGFNVSTDLSQDTPGRIA